MADWLRPTLRRRARMAQPVVAQWRDPAARVYLPPQPCQWGVPAHRVRAGTIRSSKLDVQVAGSADRGVAALLPPLSSANTPPKPKKPKPPKKPVA
jgi:hypothetical protein